MTIIVRRPWTRQPQFNVPLNADYKSSVLAYVPSILPRADIARGVALTASTSVVTKATSGGIALSGGSASYFDISSAFSVPPECSLVCIQAAFGGNFGWHGIQSAGSYLTHFPYGDGNIYVSTLSFDRWLSVSASGLKLAEPHVVVVAGESTGSYRWLYHNGRLIGSNLSGTAGVVQMGSRRIGSNDNTWYYFNGDTYALVIIPRVISASEVAARFSSAEQAWGTLFSLRQIIIPSAAVAASVPSITAVAASAITSTSVTPVITLNFP